LESGQSIEYKNGFNGNGVYLVLINGSIEVNETELSSRDAIGIWDTDSFNILAKEQSELLAIEVPMHI
jgi:redox-sensitive bicupin YhaK (pirin superfamily)